MSTVSINARMDSQTKEEAVSILHSLGLNTTQAIHLYFRQIIYTKSIPFAIKLPSRETLKAINELEAGGGETFATVEDLLEDLKD